MLESSGRTRSSASLWGRSWQNRTRTAAGELQPDAERFPHGIKWLADYMHSRGLKLGIYTDYGSATCEGYPGTDLEHQEIDAKTFAKWGVDR